LQRSSLAEEAMQPIKKATLRSTSLVFSNYQNSSLRRSAALFFHNYIALSLQTMAKVVGLADFFQEDPAFLLAIHVQL
jgi:hypothetical protein